MAAAGSSNVGRVYVKPYMYSPLSTDQPDDQCCGEDDSDISDDDSWEQLSYSESSEEEEEIVKQSRCTCGTCCLSSRGNNEGLCCLSFTKVRSRLERTDFKCITQHPGFRDNCLSLHVLELSVFESSRKDGPIRDDQHIHEIYRDLSIQRFKRWIFKKFGKMSALNDIPSCVIKAIMTSFPKEDKADFKYPRP